ncbi:MAG TPA: ATP-binding protein, partial [Bacteroidales bacterium]|nr:ATP-binding protein [Bacteroidales bacterium]
LYFASVLLVSDYFHEKKFRIGTLNEKLNEYASMAEWNIIRYGMRQAGNYERLDSLFNFVSGNDIRVTLIDTSGRVVYDSKIEDVRTMQNHRDRPEVMSALSGSTGTDIRVSGTTNVKYYYYAKKFGDLIVRISAVYDLNTRRFIQPERLFTLLVVLVLLIASLSLVLVNDKLGKSISTLREFTQKASGNKPIDGDLIFPESELGNLGQEIMDIYHKNIRAREELISEKSKLMRHLNMLDEGIAIFSKDRNVITSNTNFIRFSNKISDKRIFTADEFFRIPDFIPVFHFIDRFRQDHVSDLNDVQPIYEINISKNGKHFSVKSVVYQDKSFEISIHDISKPTKRKILKQQITENIAHELKTPVSSIKGFLETILHGNTDEKRTSDYLKRAYTQTLRLADLINDISLLTKIEEAGSLYKIEEIHITGLLNEIRTEIETKLREKSIEFEIKTDENLTVFGSGTLLYSVFRNLLDNSVDHAGEQIVIRIENYLKDDEYLYFSYYDTGTGVPEQDLPRLFERFYRVEKGRDRKKGGTGLGLAIVKNAIQFHKGEISVRNRNGGGLEFLFHIAKDIRKSNTE